VTDELELCREAIDVWFSHVIQNRALIGLRGDAYQEAVATAALHIDMIYNPEGTE